MNESDTRLKKIDPALRAAGCGVVEGSDIFTEQRAYLIAPGRVARLKERNPKKIDYLLVYKNQKIGIIEAKSDEKLVTEGVEQAKEYAQRMNIQWTYSTNGDYIWAINMKANCGDFTEGFVPKFPTPDELWRMTFPDKNDWRDKFNLIPFNRDGGKSPRYYQEIAANKVLEAISKKKNRILLTLATGTGKTYIAFQIVWKLFQARWNVQQNGRLPRVLFLADRNILANQAFNAFGAFDQTALARITPAEIRKNGGRVPTGQSIYFTIFQTLLCGTDGEHVDADNSEFVEYYKQYPQDFFDFIIIDECHRGGANDESEWRKLMEYFKPAYQLGLTATPRRQINADTYAYFGEPVYIYSLKQGIEDGYLTPYRVKICKNRILDEYKFNPDDTIISGADELDPDKVYTEKDFYHGNIKIQNRDEARVVEFLDQIESNDKSIVFCATQNHAMQIRDMINKHSKDPNPFYCVRVTADDGSNGEEQLRKFQDNEKTIPTILTTSQKLSTGVDAQNVRNIVLMRPVTNMIEFKQIIGRGTRLFDEKYYFTIYDFAGAYQNFYDPEWDGEPAAPDPPAPPKPPKEHKPCEKCGQWPCVCSPEPCPVCGNLPCTCPGPKRTIIEIQLSETRSIEAKKDFRWEEKFMYDGRLIDLNEFVTILFGRLPSFFKSNEDLHTQWKNPETRFALLDHLGREGFPLDKIEMVQKLLRLENCDLLDVLEYLAYNTTPIERQRRVELVRQEIMVGLTPNQNEFVDFVLKQYILKGYKELSLQNLPELIKLKYGTVNEAKPVLGSIGEINKLFVGFQQSLYTA